MLLLASYFHCLTRYGSDYDDYSYRRKKALGNKVKAAQLEMRPLYQVLDHNSQIRFRVDKAGWITYIRLPLANYNIQNFTVKCKVIQKDENKSTSEVISAVVRTILASNTDTDTEYSKIEFQKPVRIYPGKWYWISIRFNVSFDLH